MAEAGRPQYSTPLAADDMIGSLATRVRELSLRVAQLEGELEAARRRVAVYEDFDAQVQDSLSAALRASNQIRERARVSAEAIAEEARAQRPSTVAELDAMRIERDALRRAIDGAGSGGSRVASPAATVPMAEMRTAATEALRGVFKELVAEIRAMPQESARQAPAPAAVQAPASAPPRPSSSPSTYASPPVSQMPAAQQPAAVQSPPPAPSAPVAQPYEAPRTPPVSAPQQQAPPYVPPSPPPAPTYTTPQASAFSRPTVVPQRERAEVVEDVDVDVAPMAPPPAAPPPAAAAPVAQQEARAPAPAPAPAAPEPGPPSTEAVGEIQIVLSPISSFPRLVELERRLQGMPVVRTVYARDFRNGVATLAIGLRHPMTVDEFAGSVTKLDYPRLRIISTSGYVLELRIDTEASSIA
ncbi:MAG: DivIVA domain-containing protein [Chloroflexota bacterium]|nr:DivIVA domain-containing protein [Chloroflexota bacterium]